MVCGSSSKPHVQLSDSKHCSAQGAIEAGWRAAKRAAEEVCVWQSEMTPAVIPLLVELGGRGLEFPYLALAGRGALHPPVVLCWSAYI